MTEFSIEKEFEFNVWKEVVDEVSDYELREHPFDGKIRNHYIEFKLVSWNPAYDNLPIKFTRTQSEEMVEEGNYPVLLVDGENGFYFLDEEEVEELVNNPSRLKYYEKEGKPIIITENFLGDPIEFDELLENISRLE